MANILEICRICLNVNAKMFTLKNTDMENLYTLLTQAYVDIEDGKPTTVCFICYAKLRNCNRLQQQAVKANELLEQMLRGRIMHPTAVAILNSQYASQDLQVTSTYYLDLEPLNCEDVLLDPKVEVDSLISVKEEVEDSKDEGHNVADYPEDAKYSYGFGPEAIYSDPEGNQPLMPICSDEVYNFAHRIKGRKQHEEENKCLIKQEKEVNAHQSHSTQTTQKDKTCNSNKEAKGIFTKSEIKLEKTKIRLQLNDHKIQKLSYNENKNKQKVCLNRPKSPAINTIIDEFRCNKCSKQFSTEEILTDHILKCMTTTENFLSDNQLTEPDELMTFPLEMYSCDICTFETNLKRSLEIHLKMHNVDKVLSCNICEYRCTYDSELERHMRKHTDEKPIFCNHCDYRCARKGTLKVHMKTHTGEKPFSCNICEYRCAHRFSLKVHMRNHTGERPFSCNNCEYKCSRKSDLNIHIKTHTGEKPFSCNICRYRCIRRGDLKTHIKNHIGEKPFSCTMCEYRCARKVHIKQHMIKHTGEKPYSCNICEYRCARKGDLNKHTLTHAD